MVMVVFFCYILSVMFFGTIHIYSVLYCPALTCIESPLFVCSNVPEMWPLRCRLVICGIIKVRLLVTVFKFGCLLVLCIQTCY